MKEIGSNTKLTCKKVYDSKTSPIGKILDGNDHCEKYLYSLSFDGNEKDFIIQKLNGEYVDSAQETTWRDKRLDEEKTVLNLEETILSNTKLGVMVADQYRLLVQDELMKEPKMRERYDEMCEMGVNPKEAMYICAMGELCKDVEFFHLDPKYYADLVSDYNGMIRINMYSKEDMEKKVAMIKPELDIDPEKVAEEFQRRALEAEDKYFDGTLYGEIRMFAEFEVIIGQFEEAGLAEYLNASQKDAIENAKIKIAEHRDRVSEDFENEIHIAIHQYHEDEERLNIECKNIVNEYEVDGLLSLLDKKRSDMVEQINSDYIKTYENAKAELTVRINFADQNIETYEELVENQKFMQGSTVYEEKLEDLRIGRENIINSYVERFGDGILKDAGVERKEIKEQGVELEEEFTQSK